MEVLLIGPQDITKNTPLGGNIDIDRFKYCISDAQISKLEPMLGEVLYAKIIAEYSPTITLTGLYLILYEKYIVPFLIHQASVEYLLVGAYQITNGGIFKHTPTNGTPIEKNEVDYLVQNQRSKAEIYQERMEKWLCLNNLPEWREYNNTTVVHAKNQSTGGWYFGN